MWTQQKCALRAHSGLKGGVRKHPSEFSNDEWDTIQSCGLNVHMAATKSARPQVHMKCAIWDMTIDCNVKKGQQRLYFLLQVRKFSLPQKLLLHFYSTVIESSALL